MEIKLNDMVRVISHYDDHQIGLTGKVIEAKSSDCWSERFLVEAIDGGKYWYHEKHLEKTC